MSEPPGGFGARLRARRQAAGLSQQELAERSGLSVRAVSDLERGRTRWPYPGSLHRLADALELRDAPRAEFIAAAGRRLGHMGAPGGAGTTGSTGTTGTTGPAETAGGSRAAEPGAATGLAGGTLRRAAGTRVVPRQLPAPIPAFVGRDDQLTAMSRILQVPGGTAVIAAIGGTAGVGKSALAVQWAHAVAGQFPDGQLFVNLRGFGPSDAPVTVAEAVRVFLDALQIPADRIPLTVDGQLGLYRSLLAGKRMLVVLDNARDVTQVRPLLPGSPTCRVVVTSRSQLTGLTAIEAARPLILDVMPPAEARLLLRHRLGAARLAAEPGAAEQIIRACARLPLALCVIAARTAMTPDLPLAQVAAGLTARQDLDAFADVGDPAADVRAAFSWSYRQLDPGAARVFRLAGEHPGPHLEQFSLAALAGLTAEQAGRMLEALARACMIQPAGPARYSVHDLLRGYARELAASQDTGPERAAALTRLLDHYLYTAATAMDTAFPAERHRRPRVPEPAGPIPEFAGPDAAVAWLEAERASLVAVAVAAAEQGRPDYAIRLSATLFRYLDTQGHYAEATVLLTGARRAARQAGDHAAEAEALNNLGVMELRQGRYAEAARHLEEALALYRQTTERAGEPRALSNLGFIDFLLGRPQQAAGHLGEALARFRELGDQVGEARTLASLGYVQLRQGHYEQAAADLRQSADLCEQAGDQGGVGRALGMLGDTAYRQRRYDQATALLRQSLTVFREIGDRISETDSLTGLGLVDLAQGRYEQATGQFSQALAACDETGDLSSRAAALNGLGELLLATGRPGAARQRLTAALEAATEAGEKYEQARAHSGLARALQASGDTAAADRHRDLALALFTEFGAPEAGQIRAELAARPATVSR